MDGEVTYSPPWKNALDELFGPDGYGYGDVIPHGVIHQALRMPKPVGRVEVEVYEDWRLRLVSQIDALSLSLLEDRNMCLASVPGEGYKVVPPGEQTQYAVKKGQREMRSALQKMGRRLSFLDRSALTGDQAKENADALARLSFLQTQVGRRKLIS